MIRIKDSFLHTFTRLGLQLLNFLHFPPLHTFHRPAWSAFPSAAAAAAAKSLQSCPTLCHPIDGSPPGSPVPGIFQARTLEWVAISFSNSWKGKEKVKLLSRVRPSATPWTAAFQAPPSMGFSRQEYWSGVPLSSLAFPSANPVKVLLFRSLCCFLDIKSCPTLLWTYGLYSL